MSLGFVANMLCTWKRTTSYILDPQTATENITVTRQPSEASTLQVKLTPATGTGDIIVTITGYINNDESTEYQAEFTFSETGYQTTAYPFSEITEDIEVLNGRTPPTMPEIEIKSLGGDGSPRQILYTMKGPGFPVAFSKQKDRGKAAWPVREPGTQGMEDGIILVPVEETWTPRTGDLVINDRTSEIYEVERVEDIDPMWLMFWRCTIKRVARATS